MQKTHDGCFGLSITTQFLFLVLEVGEAVIVSPSLRIYRILNLI